MKTKEVVDSLLGKCKGDKSLKSWHDAKMKKLGKFAKTNRAPSGQVTTPYTGKGQSKTESAIDEVTHLEGYAAPTCGGGSEGGSIGPEEFAAMCLDPSCGEPIGPNEEVYYTNQEDGTINIFLHNGSYDFSQEEFAKIQELVPAVWKEEPDSDGLPAVKATRPIKVVKTTRPEIFRANNPVRSIESLTKSIVNEVTRQDIAAAPLEPPVEDGNPSSGDEFGGDAKAESVMRALNSVASGLNELGIDSTVEHPGYIDVQLPGYATLAFGFANGQFGWNLCSGGEHKCIDSGESTLRLDSEPADLIAYAHTVVMHCEKFGKTESLSKKLVDKLCMQEVHPFHGVVNDKVSDEALVYALHLLKQGLSSSDAIAATSKKYPGTDWDELASRMRAKVNSDLSAELYTRPSNADQTLRKLAQFAGPHRRRV